MKFKTFLKSNSDFLKNIFISTVIGVCASFLNYYFNVLLARNLPSSEFGIYSAALGIISIIQVPSLAISSAVTKFVAGNRGKNLKIFKKDLFKKFFIIAFIFSVLFFILSPVISDISNIPQKYMFPLTIVLFLSFFNPLTKGILYGLEKPNKGNFLNLTESVLKICIGFLAINIYRGDATLPILAHGLPLILTGILIYPFIGNIQDKGNIHGSINFKNVILYFFLFVFLSIPYTLDLSLVNSEFRPEYSALSLIGKIVYFASIMITSVMFSKAANLKDKRERRKVLNISLYIALFIGVCLSLLYWFIPEYINNFVYGGKYPEITEYLGIYGLGMTLYASTYLIYNYFIIENFIRSIYWLIFTAIIQILLFFFRNDSLEHVVQNQLFLYILMFLGSIILLKIYVRKMDDTGIEPVTSTM